MPFKNFSFGQEYQRLRNNKDLKEQSLETGGS